MKKLLLEEIVLPFGFRIFRDSKFRELVKFNSLGICFALFCLDFADALVKLEDYH